MRRVAACLFALAVAGCSSAGINTAPVARTIDLQRDDLSEVLLALDVPRGIAPIDGASTLNLDVTVAGTGERKLSVPLRQADADERAEHLTPPATGRTYYFLSFDDAGKTAIRNLQAWLRASGQGGAAGVLVGVTPHLCGPAGVTGETVTVSVLAALPGSDRLAPLVDRQHLSDLGASGPLPACG